MTTPAAYTALVAGSTGAVGRALVAQLVASPRCNRVIALTRRDIPEEQWPKVFPALGLKAVEHKLELRKVDFDVLSERDINTDDNIDAAFWCLGTTGTDAESSDAWHKVDVEYLTRAGVLIKAANTPYFGLVSSYGASRHSLLWYMRMKAECEDTIQAMGFERTSIFQPAFMRRGDLARSCEDFIAQYLFPSVDVEGVAKAMVLDYESNAKQGKVWTHWELRAVD